MQKNKISCHLEHIAEKIGLPRDLAFHDPILTLMGENEILIENYKKILEYTSHHLLIQTANCKIRIEGRQLVVEYYTSDEMKVKGKFTSIFYDQ
ncbi:MAG: sporulation protein [Clostridia bacterium]|nr:sporulation protein [Clostridia bacterium]NCC44040.1 sporulation protein [Clostridia bacterium]